jgi:two-component system nitrate/nitrite response regulator NarL
VKEKVCPLSAFALFQANNKEKDLWSVMKIIVISNYAVLREGIVSVISKHKGITLQFACETLKDAMFMIKSNMTDFILLDIHEDNKDELKLINELRAAGIKIKTIILDFYGDNELFIDSLKCGVQGYILGKSNENEILYALDQISKGKKYFDSYFVECKLN